MTTLSAATRLLVRYGTSRMELPPAQIAVETPTASPTAQPPKTLSRAGNVTTAGRIDDDSLNTISWNLMEIAAEKHGVEVACFQP